MSQYHSAFCEMCITIIMLKYFTVDSTSTVATRPGLLNSLTNPQKNDLLNTEKLLLLLRNFKNFDPVQKNITYTKLFFREKVKNNDRNRCVHSSFGHHQHFFSPARPLRNM